MLKRLWNDESGAVLSAELILLVTILGIGMITGLKAVQSMVVNELGEIGTALGTISQAYSYSGSNFIDGCATTDGSCATDANNASNVDPCATSPTCVPVL